MSDKPVALIMLSGGLDSTIAAKVMMEMGVSVRGINFYTGFCIIEQRRRMGGKNTNGKSLVNDGLRAGGDLGIPVDLIDISKNYFKMVTNPRYGYGSAANPCIDCRIFMMTRIREMIDRGEGDFLVTGEVLGQRPMSQHKQALNLIETKSGLTGLIVRPLSAKLLPPTIPEEKGWISREKMFDISGRSRKPQIALAEKLGISNYPQPAGGCCFLTDHNFAKRFHDFLTHEFLNGEELDIDKVVRLRAGRHFRLSNSLRVIVSRDEGENKLFENYRKGRWSYLALDTPGPLTIVEGTPNEDEHALIGSITARYSDAKEMQTVQILCEKDDEKRVLNVNPWQDAVSLESMRI